MIIKAIDNDIRAEATHDLRTSFFVEAGAGTGKTRILIDRTVKIIRSGAAELNQLIIITFTEKAAAELRSRLRDQLHDELLTTNIEEKARCEAALREVASAHIDTVHGFSSSLLREFPLDTGIDPGFQQLDAMAGDIDFQKHWDNWIWNIKDKPLLAVERCLKLGLSLSTVRTIASILDRHRDLSLSPILEDSPEIDIFLDVLVTTIDQAEALSDSCTQRTDECLKKYRELKEKCLAAIQVHSRTYTKGNTSTVQSAVNSISFQFRRNYGNRINWNNLQDLEQMRKLLRSADEHISRFRIKQNQIALHQLTKEIAKFVKNAALARLRNGKLNFDDLLIEARRLVLNKKSVRQALQKRFRFILVDEFQDTDPLQAELIFLLAADSSSDLDLTPNWHDVTLVRGKLFLVGDPKQSIYRFRRADIDTYVAAKKIYHNQLPTYAKIISVSQNFRSVPSIVSWINQTFKQALKPDPTFPGAQPEYSSIHAYRSSDASRGVILLYSDTGVWDTKLPQLRGEEANAIARLVTNLVDNPKWTISGESEPAHQISFRDICILVESRTAIESYTHELSRHNIPHIIDGGGDLFKRQEIRELLAILQSIDDPSDQTALIAALKSTAFSCSDTDLLEFHTSGQNFNILSGEFPNTIVGSAMSRLSALYTEKSNLSLPLLIDKIVREEFLIESLLVTKSERQHASNLKYIIEKAVQFSTNESDMLRPFVHWLSQQQTDARSQTNFHLTETDDDVVRIMTIHGAKGLEFPVVILAKLSGGTSSDRSQSVVDRTRGVIDFAVGTHANRFETVGFQTASIREKSYSRAEAARLMYVASTRARELLVVSVYKSESRPGMFQYLPGLPSWKEVIDDGLRNTKNGAAIVLDGNLPRRPIIENEVPHYPSDFIDLWKKKKADRNSKLLGGPVYTSPSEITSNDSERMVSETSLITPTSNVGDSIQIENNYIDGEQHQARITDNSAKSVALRRGTLVHEVLCRCELSDPDNAILWTKRLSSDHGTPSLSSDVVKHVLKIINSTSIKRVLNSKNILRELPLTWHDGHRDRYVEGFLDLAFEEEDGWVLVDYKTDSLTTPISLALETLLSRYQPQVIEYRNAAQAVGMQVKAYGVWLTETGKLYLWYS